MKVAVIGSGPSATGAVLALVARGVRPDVIDIGEGLDEKRAAIVAALAATPRADWPLEALAQIGDNSSVTGDQIPRKLVFGSDYIYAREREYGRVQTIDVDFVPTHSAGGYSTVWGAAILPMHADDMTAWPVARHDLDEHYRAVAAALPLTGERDALAESFPTFREELGSARLSTPLRALLGRLRRRGADVGLHHQIGCARLAVQDGGPHACIGCGLCLTGCPMGSIYSTPDTLDPLERAGKLRRRNGYAVLSIAENADAVALELFHTEDRKIEWADYQHVFLAAGAVNSSRILLNSRKLFDVCVLLRDSQKVAFSALLLKPLGLHGREEASSLAGVFMELKLDGRSQHWFHAQIYGVNDLMLRHFRIDPFGPTPLLKRPLRALLNHALLLWGGLHSDHSSAIALSIQPDGARAMPLARLAAIRNPATPRYVGHLRRALSRLLRPASAYVVGMGELALPGGGWHIGGSFPMRAFPRSDLETDMLGRPFGWRNVYLVDGACLPSIPAAPSTFTMMANAHRIASKADLGSPA
jgi:choline dehydrogenase-like flavoprotein